MIIYASCSLSRSIVKWHRFRSDMFCLAYINVFSPVYTFFFSFFFSLLCLFLLMCYQIWWNKDLYIYIYLLRDPLLTKRPVFVKNNMLLIGLHGLDRMRLWLQFPINYIFIWYVNSKFFPLSVVFNCRYEIRIYSVLWRHVCGWFYTVTNAIHHNYRTVNNFMTFLDT